MTSVERWRQPERPVYRGSPCQQFEEDLVAYAFLIHTLRPPFIIEVGRALGGTALYLADHLALARPEGIIISVDIEDPERGWSYPRVVPLVGDSVSVHVVNMARDFARGKRGMVLLDGDHDPVQVREELLTYAPLADCLIVEDTIMRELGMEGPADALDVWLPQHPEWTVRPDPVLTQHPGGWLLRKVLSDG